MYHALLNAGQSNALEKLHRHAICVCYGFDKDREQVMADNHIETMGDRRILRVDAFIRKAISNDRFGNWWFPPRVDVRHHLRKRRSIQETRAFSLRRFKSPRAYMRRRANELGLSPTSRE